MNEHEFKGLGLVIKAMLEGGFQLTSSESGPMDSGMAVFNRKTGTVKIMKDRGQWFYEGTAQALQPYGLWKAFNDLEEFIAAIRNYHKKTIAIKTDKMVTARRRLKNA